MYGQADYHMAYANGAHRFNPNAPAFRMGFGAATYAAPDPTQGLAPADYAPNPMNAAMIADQQRHLHYGPHSGPGHDAHQASFGSSNTSFSGPSTPAGPHAIAKRNRYSHNPYAGSNASSEPSSPAMAPAAAPNRAADGFCMSSGNTSSVQSPVYAPDTQGYAADAASHHPIAYSIHEQFTSARGNLASAACTPRGRHMLVAALRQQHTDKIQAIFEELAPNVSAIIMDPQGGHVIRTMIEFLNESQVATLVDYLSPEVVLTVATSSQHTRRVLQTLFERHRTTALQPVVDVIATHAIALSTTQQGCIAVMRCIEHTTDNQKHQVLEALTPQLAALTMDPYGNYVVQAVLQYFSREVACEVIEKAFAGHWVNLSCNKFASNVMEKFIKESTPVTRKTILEELVYDNEALSTLMQDGFGNFVLQQIIDTCTTGPEYRRLAERVRPLLGASPFGHKIEAKLKSKRFGPPYESGAQGGAGGSRHANRKRGDNHKDSAKSERGHGVKKPQVNGTDCGAIHVPTDSKEASSRSVSNGSSCSAVLPTSA